MPHASVYQFLVIFSLKPPIPVRLHLVPALHFFRKGAKMFSTSLLCVCTAPVCPVVVSVQRALLPRLPNGLR
jgi:hypothetical protein